MGKRGHLWTLLRVLVCVVALFWVLQNVQYYDHVVLTTGETLRLVSAGSTEDAALTAVDDTGQTLTILAKDVARDEAGALRIDYGLRTTIRGANITWVVLALLVFMPVTLFQSLRFLILLRAQGIDIRYWESVKLCYAGNFLNFVTALGTTGGDVFKMYYVSLHTDRKTEAVMTVLLDRVFGLIGLVLLVTVVCTVRVGDEKLAFLRSVSWAIFLVIAVAVTLVGSSRMRRWAKVDSAIRRLPHADHFVRIVDGVQRLAGHKVAVFGAMASTAILQCLATVSFACVAVAVGLRSDVAAVWDYFAYIPSAMAIAAVPISFQGLGTQEAFYKHVLLDSHGPLSQILCMAMAVRLVGLVWSLPGIWVTLTGTYKPRAIEKEIQFA